MPAARRLLSVTLVAVISMTAMGSAAPTRFRSNGTSVELFFQDGNVSIVASLSRTVNNDQAEQIFLFVNVHDFLTSQTSCGGASIPNSALTESGQRATVNVDLATVTWDYNCGDDGAPPPTGVISLQLQANNVSKQFVVGATQLITRGYIFHSSGTYETRSATVTGTLLGISSPPLTISGAIFSNNQRGFSIEPNTY